jgi:predicted dehydrogenase
MSQVRFGIVGAGSIAVPNIEGLLKHPSAKIVAICATSPKRADPLAERFRIPRKYYRVEQILDDRDIDAVVISVPNYLHGSIAISALEHDKHVLLDKPFAMNYTQTQRISEAVKKYKKILMVGMNQRFLAETQKLKNLIDKNILGELYFCQAYWMRRAGCPRFGTWFCRKDQAGGGAMMDIGVHIIDLAMYLVGNFDAESVCAKVYTKYGHIGIGQGDLGISDTKEQVFDVEDFGCAFIRLKGGQLLTIHASWAAPLSETELWGVDLFGTEAGGSLFPCKIHYVDDRVSKDETVKTENLALPTDRMVHFVDVVLGRSKCVCTIDEALKVQKVIDAIYESSKTNQEIKLTT